MEVAVAVNVLSLWVPPMLGLLTAWVGVAYLSRETAGIRWMDVPNSRSLHGRPTPRTGGLGILTGMVVGWLAAGAFLGIPAWMPWVLAGLVLVAVVSILDDWRGLGPGVRMLVHVLGAFCVGLAGLFPTELDLVVSEVALAGWVSASLGVLFLVWMTNLYNFMDGMDGLAGGMAVFGFGFMAVLGGVSGADSFTAFSLCVAFAAAGFLRFNFPPASIFMGDAGASTLGFLAAVAMLWADRDGIFPLWAGLLVFSPFIMDATATLVLRAISGERLWEAHRRHFYQRLVRAGWSHRRTVLVEYVLMWLAGASAVALLWSGSPAVQSRTLVAWLFLYLAVMFTVARLTARRT